MSADDLRTWQGVVLGRAVSTLRSVETQPLAWGFVLSKRRDPVHAFIVDDAELGEVLRVRVMRVPRRSQSLAQLRMVVPRVRAPPRRSGSGFDRSQVGLESTARAFYSLLASFLGVRLASCFLALVDNCAPAFPLLHVRVRSREGGMRRNGPCV